MSSSDLLRKDSGAYWDAEGWDPDDRVYVGASQGETGHLLAVQPEAGAPAPQPADAGKAEAGAQAAPASGGDSPTGKAVPGIKRRDSEDFWNNMQGSATNVEEKVGPKPMPVLQEMRGGPPPLVANMQPPSPVPGEVPPLTSYISTGSDGSFWDNCVASAGMGGAPTTQSGTSTRADSNKGEEDQKDGADESREKERCKKINRVNSAQYWDADQWDPDNRVYVGADIGQTNHLTAVDLTAQEQANMLWRVWGGGLASSTLSLGDTAGPPIDLSGLKDGRPKLNELYEINETLGVGSFGAVRSARHAASGTKCGMKAVGKATAGEKYRKSMVDNGMGELFLRMTKEAPHENVIKFFDFMEGPNHWYVVMEELSGPELMDQVEEQFPVTEAYVQRVMPQVMKPLAHLHGPSVGLVHRDVKLSNYRFRDPSPDSPLVLLDLGFACSVDDEWDGNHCGTLMFMPPEVVGSSARVPYLPGIDVWSAGVMLFVLLTGDSPVQENEVKLFEKPETAAKAEEVIAKALDSSELKLASSEVRDLLSQLLVIDPAKRSTAAEALKHSWFGQSVTGGELPVRKKSISRMKSLSSKSSRVMAKMSTGMRKGTAGSGELPNIEVGLERIVSE